MTPPDIKDQATRLSIFAALDALKKELEELDSRRSILVTAINVLSGICRGREGRDANTAGP
jgi:hypothetical protein